MPKKTALGKGLGAIFRDDVRDLNVNKETKEESRSLNGEKEVKEKSRAQLIHSADLSVSPFSENERVKASEEEEKVSAKAEQKKNIERNQCIKSETQGNETKNIVPRQNDADTKELEKDFETAVTDDQKMNVSRETFIKTSLIEPNPDQPRKKFDPASLQELADSMKTYGILQPLIVRENGQMYEIIAGERRWRAAKLAGLTEVPVMIRSFEKKEAAEIAIIENIQREDLGPVEEARAFRSLIVEYGMTQEEIAEKVGKNRTTITNSMRLLQLCDAVLKRLSDGELTAGHARCLIGIGDASEQEKLAKEIADRKLSVRETEKLIKAYQKAKKEADVEADEREQELNMYLIDLARKLTGSLGTKVQIKQGAKGHGKIEIDYYSDDDLNKIIDRLR